MAKELKLTTIEYERLENGCIEDMELEKVLRLVFYLSGNILVSIPWLEHID